MKNKIIISLFLLSFGFTFSQEKKLEREAKENIREGNALYNQLKFKEAEIVYKKALAKKPIYPKAIYNLANTLYQQNRNKEAIDQFELANKTYKKKGEKAEAYHNIGNAFMKEKQYQKAVEAYKNALRNNSKDDETRYNLAIAKEQLKKQKNKNKNKKNKKDDKKNKGNKKKDQKNQKDKNNSKKDKGNNNKDKKKEQQKKQPRRTKLNPQQMQQLLEAMNNEENKTQKKLNARKAKAKKIKREKDW